MALDLREHDLVRSGPGWPGLAPAGWPEARPHLASSCSAVPCSRSFCTTKLPKASLANFTSSHPACSPSIHANLTKTVVRPCPPWPDCKSWPFLLHCSFRRASIEGSDCPPVPAGRMELQPQHRTWTLPSVLRSFCKPREHLEHRSRKFTLQVVSLLAAAPYRDLCRIAAFFLCPSP